MRATVLVAGVVVGLAGSTAVAGTIIGNVGSWNGTQGGQSFGSGVGGTFSFETVGQTFVVPAGESKLSRASFYLAAANTGSGPIPFDVRIMAWDDGNSRATGSTLFQSGTINAPGSSQGLGFLRYDVAIPNLSVAAGSQYVVIITAAPYPPLSPLQRLRPGYIISNYATGGRHVMQDGTGGTAAFTAAFWYQFTGSLAHELEFADGAPVIPLPHAGGMAMAGLGLLAMRRRRATV